MLENLVAIENRYNELSRLLEENLEDYQRAAELAKERSDLEQIFYKVAAISRNTGQNKRSAVFTKLRG